MSMPSEAADPTTAPPLIPARVVLIGPMLAATLAITGSRFATILATIVSRLPIIGPR